MRIKLIDLDGSLVSQAPLVERLSSREIDRIDALDLAKSMRIVARRKSINRFIERAGMPEPAKGPEVIFYGSGDFHHLTAALVQRHRTPLTIIHFDNHPDWVRFPPTFNCGAWVNRALEMPHIRKIITLGPCSDDLIGPEGKSANLSALRDGRLEVFPFAHGPSQVRANYGDGPSHRQSGNTIEWQQLSQLDWLVFLADLSSRIQTETVYITIDKDVFAQQDATTNWDQGLMPLEYVTEAVRTLASRFNITGIDVCGDYSKPAFHDPFRWALAHFDHPRGINPDVDALDINAVTNAKLLDCFEDIFK